MSHHAASSLCPEFAIPMGTQSVQVRIIDSTTRIGKLPVKFLMEPPMPNMEHMPILPSWSFLIDHVSGKKLLFDLGVPRDWHDFAPVIVQRLEQRGWDITVEKEVIDVLQEDGIAADQISSIIWSHSHWDHLGDPSRFPLSTELIVGPGFKSRYCPGYPADPNATVRESDFAGRTVREVDFTDAVAAGEFRAFDFFGDGSFYILDAPGHDIGHLCALARTTTNPDTFIFMGGDLCHHSGEIRPSKHLRLPSDVVRPSAGLPCPGAAADYCEQLLISRNRAVDQPFFLPAMGVDISEAVKTIEKAQEADARDNIWFIYAHDPSLMEIVDLFPSTANRWKERGWREKTLWHFLRDFVDPTTEQLRH